MHELHLHDSDCPGSLVTDAVPWIETGATFGLLVVFELHAGDRSGRAGSVR